MTLHELEKLKQDYIAKRAMSEDRARARITVGMGTCGIKAGAESVLEELEKVFADTDIIVTYTGCIGLCSYEPVVEVALPGHEPVLYLNMTPEKVRKIVVSEEWGVESEI